MTIPVSDVAVLTFLREWYGDPTLILSDFDTDGVHMPTRARAAIEAALPELLELQGYIAEVELGGLEAARNLGTKSYGTLWSEPTGQAGTAIYTIRHPTPGREGQDNG